MPFNQARCSPVCHSPHHTLLHHTPAHFTYYSHLPGTCMNLSPWEPHGERFEPRPRGLGAVHVEGTSQKDCPLPRMPHMLGKVLNGGKNDRKNTESLLTTWWGREMCEPSISFCPTYVPKWHNTTISCSWDKSSGQKFEVSYRHEHISCKPHIFT